MSDPIDISFLQRQQRKVGNHVSPCEVCPVATECGAPEKILLKEIARKELLASTHQRLSEKYRSEAELLKTYLVKNDE